MNSYFPLFLILLKEMHLKPMSRERMLKINSQSDEETLIQSENFRVIRVEYFIQNMYMAILNIAINTKRTSYTFPVGETFYLENMNNIIAGLQSLFPGCIVSIVFNNSYIEESNRPYISVDWS